MWGWLPGRLILSGPLVGLGRPGLLLRKQGGWLVLWCLACVVGAGVGLVAWCWHRRHARCGGLLGLLWSWWSAVVGAPAWCGGGMLSGCLNERLGEILVPVKMQVTRDNFCPFRMENGRTYTS